MADVTLNCGFGCLSVDGCQGHCENPALRDAMPSPDRTLTVDAILRAYENDEADAALTIEALVELADRLAMSEASDLEGKWPRYEAALRNARAWVFECWGWLMETDLDMKCPMEVDPLDIVEQIDALLGIDTALANQRSGSHD